MDEKLKKNIAAYFIIFIMIFSTAGFAVYFATPSTKKTEAKQITPPQTLPMNFEADVNAKVDKLLSTFVVFGYTNEGTITNIDKQLLRIKGVRNVDSKLNLNNQTSITATYTYMATVYGYNLELDTLKEALKDVNELESPVVYRYAQISFDNKVLFKNNDLNLTKEYEFGNPTASVIVSPFTKEGDEIKVKLYATFLNNSITKMMGEETENITNHPKQAQFMSNFKVNFEKTAIALTGPKVKDLNLQLEDVNVEKHLDFNAIYVFSEDKNVDSLLTDLNKYDVNVSAFWLGNIFVSKIMYENKPYDYNKEVSVQIPYGDYNIDDELIFLVNATIQRGKVLSVYAMPQNITIKGD